MKGNMKSVYYELKPNQAVTAEHYRQQLIN